MKKRFKKTIFTLFIFVFVCLVSFTVNIRSVSASSFIPNISINLFHVTWVEEIEKGIQINGIEWGDKSFISNGVSYSYFKYYYTLNRVQLYYEDFLVYDNGWLNDNYRVISYNNEYDFIDSTEDFVADFENYPFTIGYNIPINLNNYYYRFTNPNPINNTGNQRIWLNFYTTYFVPYEWQDSSGSFSQFEQPRNFWNNLYITSSSIDYCYSFTSEFGLETTSFLLLNNNEWSQNGGKGIPQDQVIRIADNDVSYDIYVFLVNNGYFGTYTELTYTPTDPDSFGALVKSIANTPVEILQSILDINMLGVNLFSVFCGIITIFLVIFVLKRIT